MYTKCPEKGCIDHIIKHYCRDTFFTKQSQVDRQTNKHGISNKKISTENAAPFFFYFKNVSSYCTDTKSQQHGTDRQQQIRRHGDQFIMIKIFTDTDDHIKRQ